MNNYMLTIIHYVHKRCFYIMIKLI